MAIDESTTIKSPTAKRTKTVCSLRTLAKYRRILTGSPVTKSPLDLYTQCYFLDPELLGHASYYSFKNRYAVMISRSVATHSFKQIVDYQRLDELEHNISIKNIETGNEQQETITLHQKITEIEQTIIK